MKGIGGFFAIDTGDGLVMIDAGSQLDIETGYQEIKKWRPNEHLKAAIFTHHHVDHIGYAGPLAALTGVQVYTSAAEAEHAKWLYALAGEDFGNLLAETYHRYGLPVESIKAARTAGSRYRRNTAPLPEFRLLWAGEEIEKIAGSWRVRTQKGHSDAQISFIEKDTNI